MVYLEQKMQVLVILLGISVILMLIARMIRWLVWKIDVFNGRHMSVHIARGVTIAIVVVIMGAAYFFVAGGGLAAFANARFAGSDTTTESGVVQPSNAEVSGSSIWKTYPSFLNSIFAAIFSGLKLK